MKTLIVYYSYTGKTALVAQELASKLGADLREIRDKERPSTLAAYFVGSYKALRNIGTEIQPMEVSCAGYDRVFVGSPVWAGRPAPPVNTFLKQADFTGKQVVAFVTMGGSNPAVSLEKMGEAITAQGGTVTGSFSIKTGGRSDEQIRAAAREKAENNK